jgi:hypothetical protein
LYHHDCTTDLPKAQTFFSPPPTILDPAWCRVLFCLSPVRWYNKALVGCVWVTSAYQSTPDWHSLRLVRPGHSPGSLVLGTVLCRPWPLGTVLERTVQCSGIKGTVQCLGTGQCPPRASLSASQSMIRKTKGAQG